MVNGIFMVPLYLHYFSISTYGSWLAALNIVGLSGLLESGFSGVITQKMSYAYSNSDYLMFRKFATTNIVFAIVTGFISFIIFFFLTDLIPTWLKVDNKDIANFKLALFFLAASSSINLIVNLIGAFPQVWQLTFYNGIINVISVIIGIGVILLCLVNNYSVASIGIGFFAKSLVALLLNSFNNYLIWRRLKISKLVFDKFNFFETVKTTSLFLFSKIASLLISNSQNVIITTLVSPAFTAMYDFTTKLISTLKILINIMGSSVFGSLTAISASKNQNLYSASLQKVFLIFNVLFYGAAMISFVFSEAVIRLWVGESFFISKMVLVVAIAASFFAERRYLMIWILIGVGEYKKTPLLDLLFSVVFLFLTIVFVKWLGIFGIPITLLLTSLIFAFAYDNLVGQISGVNTKSFYTTGYQTLIASVILSAAFYLMLPFNASLTIVLVLTSVISIVYGLICWYYLPEIRLTLNQLITRPIKS
jgi:O-antigen/teichoic acid export membrane protein